MLSTIDPGDRVIALKLTEPERNDIIIVNMGDKSIIKRLIAMEGDTVEIIDGELYLNDELLEEDYINEPMHLDTYEKVLLEEGELFVLGDNRNFSIDSIETGPVTMDDYEGKAKILFNLWSKFEFVK